MLTAIFRTCKNMVLKNCLLLKIISVVKVFLYVTSVSLPQDVRNPFLLFFYLVLFSVLMKKYFIPGKYLFIKNILTSVFLLAHNLFSLSPSRLCDSLHSLQLVKLCRIKAKGSEVRSFAWRGVSVNVQVLCFRTGLYKRSETCMHH